MRALLGLLLVLGLARATLLDRGAASLPDESRHYNSCLAAELFLQGEGRAAVRLLFDTEGRPGDAIVRLLPAAGQLGWRRVSGQAYANPVSLRIATAWNLLVSLALTAVVWRLARRLLTGERAALLATAVHALLANTNLYLRHLLPYDAALLLHLLALERALAPGARPRRWLFIGLLLGLGQATYPGHFALPPLVLLLALRRGGVRAGTSAGGAALATLVLFELLARGAGMTFLGSSAELAGTITHGDPAESLGFLPRYLLLVEGPVGLVLLGLAVLWAIRRARALARGEPGPGAPELGLLLAGLAALYLLHGVVALASGKLVFYGRIVHLHIPFVVLAAVAALEHLPRRRVLEGLLLIALALSLAGFARSYLGLGYPRDVLLEEGIESPALDPRRVWELPPLLAIASPPGTRAARPAARLVLVNFGLFWPTPGTRVQPHAVPPGSVVRCDLPHFQSFPAYQLEGSSPEQRRVMASWGPRLLVYEPIE